MRFCIILSLSFFLVKNSFGDIAPDYIDYKADLSLSSWIFPESPIHNEQKHNNYSFSFEPEIYLEWSNSKNFVFRPFYRLDSQDNYRTHFDFRELKYSFYGEDWESNFGIGQVFWGVTESKNVVDIINQFDAVDDPLMKTKLGKPLINLTLIRDYGYFDFYLMTYFRERTFPGLKGRLRTNPPFLKNASSYEGGSKWTPELAMRWSNSYDEYDISLHSFVGYARAPAIDIKIIDGKIQYAPNYQRIRQLGGTLQRTMNSTLLKLEWVARHGEKDSNLRRGGHISAVLGFEHTSYQSIGDNGDIGFLMEYNFDSRRSRSSDSLQDDLFLATRFNLNDAENTEMLLGTIFDLDGDGQIYQLDLGRRITDSITLGVKGAIYQNGRLGSNLYILRQDSWIELNLKKYF